MMPQRPMQADVKSVVMRSLKVGWFCIVGNGRSWEGVGKTKKGSTQTIWEPPERESIILGG